MRAENPEAAPRRASTGTHVRPSGHRLVYSNRSFLMVLAIAVLSLPVLVAGVVPSLVGTPTPTHATGAVPLATSMVNTVAQLAAAQRRIPPSTAAIVDEPTTTVAPSTTEAPATTVATTVAPTVVAPATVAVTAPPTTAAPPPPPPPPPPDPRIPDDSYWDRMAQCETGGNWAHYPDGTWTGGLGIYNQTWLSWGGGEFAPKAGQASRAQQIIVANRIAVTGHNGLAPIGFTAWGCWRTVGMP
jgi:hypothetical protein